jgi:hypothetical protein
MIITNHIARDIYIGGLCWLELKLEPSNITLTQPHPNLIARIKIKTCDKCSTQVLTPMPITRILNI